VALPTAAKLEAWRMRPPVLRLLARLLQSLAGVDSVRSSEADCQPGMLPLLLLLRLLALGGTKMFLLSEPKLGEQP
jgi:hypothetical protein